MRKFTDKPEDVLHDLQSNNGKYIKDHAEGIIDVIANIAATGSKSLELSLINDLLEIRDTLLSLKKQDEKALNNK